MKFRRSDQAKSVEINLTPLIDVVFLLLIFFMVSTTFDKKSQIQIRLPEAESSQQTEQIPDSIEIGIDAKGNYFVNDEELLNSDADTLNKVLVKITAGKTDLPVIISADGQSPHQSVIQVLDVASRLGLTQMSFATKQIRDAD
ncbi:MAG: biopolymer transporter ExbD [Chromatiales bacterium]|jgi:biopolymer transport protein ExbD